VATDDVEQDAQEWIYKTDDEIITCRGQGHDWPKLPTKATAKKKKFKGIRFAAVPDSNGVVEVHFTCSTCGKERFMVTAPRGELDLPARYRYVDPEGYQAPKGVPISRRACFQESWRRAKEYGLIDQAT